VSSNGLRLAAVVLTGGTGRRLGGVDKASLVVDGRTLLEHALRATAAADEVVVVGAELPTSRPVTWAREDPPGGGPAAGLLAGVDALVVRPDLVLALAVDMPRVSARTVERLRKVLTGTDADAACLVDGEGREQWLAGLYRYDALRTVRPAERAAEHGLALRRLVQDLRFALIPAAADEARDVDTWEEVRRLGG
jgi:molybdopterin-guanine dinucleotide biosynthesis protein A